MQGSPDAERRLLAIQSRSISSGELCIIVQRCASLIIIVHQRCFIAFRRHPSSSRRDGLAEDAHDRVRLVQQRLHARPGEKSASLPGPASIFRLLRDFTRRPFARQLDILVDERHETPVVFRRLPVGLELRGRDVPAVVSSAFRVLDDVVRAAVLAAVAKFPDRAAREARDRRSGDRHKSRGLHLRAQRQSEEHARRVPRTFRQVPIVVPEPVHGNDFRRKEQGTIREAPLRADRLRRMVRGSFAMAGAEERNHDRRGKNHTQRHVARTQAVRFVAAARCRQRTALRAGALGRRERSPLDDGRRVPRGLLPRAEEELGRKSLDVPAPACRGDATQRERTRLECGCDVLQSGMLRKVSV